MKTLIATATLLASTALTSISAYAADVGVSVSIGQPGFYGQIEIGNQYPKPAVVYNQPVIIQPVQVSRAPLYLHVPPGHAKNWRKHCRAYGACATPVYFVQDNWYNTVYVPEYRKHKHMHKQKHNDHGYHGKSHGHDGHDKGHGHGKKQHHDD